MRPDEGGHLHVACVPETESQAWKCHSSEHARTTLGMNFVISVGAKVAGRGSGRTADPDGEICPSQSCPGLSEPLTRPFFSASLFSCTGRPGTRWGVVERLKSFPVLGPGCCSHQLGISGRMNRTPDIIFKYQKMS